MSASRCARELAYSAPSKVRELLLAIVDRVTIDQGPLVIELRAGGLLELAGLKRLA